MPQFIPVDYNPFQERYEIEKLTVTNEPQKEIWLSCMIGGDDANKAYNESVSLKIKGNVNMDALKSAVSNLIPRHEALRATVSPDGETLIIYKDIPFSVHFEKLLSLEENDKEISFQEFLTKEINTAFDLKNGPLFKAWIHQTGQEEFYLTLIVHHIICDGWSTGILLEDISKMYNAIVSNNHNAFPEKPFQISDYSEEQESFRQTEGHQNITQYWLDLYKEQVPVLDLPTDRPRPVPRTYQARRIDQLLVNEKLEALKNLGTKAGTSLVTTLLTAFEVFLFQKTQQKDIVVGLPAAGQAATGLNDVVGHCVNLLPIKTHIDPTQTFTDYLQKRKKQVLDAYDHQRLTFGELLKKLYIPRDPSRIALVPVMFNIDMGMDQEVAFEDLSFELISNPRSFENFELYLNATNSGKGLILEWSYNTNLFEQHTIESFIKDFNTVLEKITHSPEKTIATLAQQEETILRSILRGKEVAIPFHETINNRFQQSCKTHADKTAVCFENSSLTYQELFERTEQVASYLIHKGIRKSAIVAVMMDRSMEMLISLLGILKSGAAYLPIDPTYPEERIAFMLKDSNARLLITSKHQNQSIENSFEEVSIEAILSTAATAHTPAIEDINADDLAYLLYTSGSTGNPKGVKITHGNLINFLLSMQETPGIKTTDTLLSVTSISFDIAGLELYLPLISGASLYIANSTATKDGRLLLELISQQNISIVQATPSTWQTILDAGWEKPYPIKILCGGEALPLELAKKLIPLSKELWNMYGPTETTIWSTTTLIDKDCSPITIGKPINNTQVYIMDEDGHPLPLEEVGEIYIGGAGVAAGYHNRSQLNTEKFIPDNYSKNRNTFLYKTGDLGKLLNTGEIICLGRIDHQLKIRGHRIEPEEIEAKITEIPDIKQTVVVSDIHSNLVAYVTLTNGQEEHQGTNWKERWDTLYEMGSEEKKSSGKTNIDAVLVEQMSNKESIQNQTLEWLENAVSRIKETGAEKIYEIGSGGGQILFEIASEVTSYIATDYSQAAIDALNQELQQQYPQWKHVKAAVATADDFSIVKNTAIDLVVINSVAQYFPHGDYLMDVIRQAAQAMEKEGCIYIGDMQGMNSLAMYHASDYLPRAPLNTTVHDFQKVVENRIRIEDELVADPEFFYLLPQLIPEITGVAVQLRKGSLINETTKYHYDIWLYVGKPVETVTPQLNLDWETVESIENVEQTLSSSEEKVIAIKNIPNSRTWQDYQLQLFLQKSSTENLLSEFSSKKGQPIQGIDPDIFWGMENKTNYKAHIRWSTDGTDNLFDVIFIHSSLHALPYYPVSATHKNIRHFIRAPFSNDVLQVKDGLIVEWKQHLQKTLPPYMIPEDFVVLKKFPLTPNAKIDRKALPQPKKSSSSKQTADIRPLTKDEKIIAAIWSEVLGIEVLKPTDDFFQLGGHSLLAVKVMVALEKQTGQRLAIATLFEHATIETLAKQLHQKQPKKEWDVIVPIQTKGDKTPLFFVHGADLNVLLFKEISKYLEPDQPVYGLQAIGINGETDIPDTIEKMVERYIADMLKVNPDKPFALAGYSLGGFIGFEIAKQLQEMGKEIAFFGIIDTYAGKTFEGNKWNRLTQKMIHEMNKVGYLSQTFIKNPLKSFKYQISVAQQKFKERFHKDGYIPKDMFTNYEVEIYKKYSDALDLYEVKEAPIKINLFVVEKRLYYLDDKTTMGWGKFAKKGVISHQVIGDHTTVLYPPNDKVLASKIQEVMNKEVSSSLLL